MSEGAILLGFLAILFAIAAAKVRRRLGRPVTLGFLAMSIILFVIFVLSLWAYNTHRTG